MQECLEGALWAVDAGRLAFEKWEAELWIHKAYAVDSANHQCAAMIDPAYHRFDASRAATFDRVLRQAYVDLDTVIGRLLDVAQEMGNTHVVVAGDHGICINNVVCDVNRRLQDVGLLAMHADGTPDLSSTLVYARPNRQGNELYVNLRGRDESGIVSARDYVKVQERAIDALLDWRGPVGKRAVCFALKKREAQIVGYWGEECGDVFFAYNQGFTWGVNPGGETIAASTALTTNHGAGVQTQDTGVTSNMGTLLAWGPKVRASARRDIERLGPVPIHHVGPTITELLGCRHPGHATGGVLAEMFAQPEGHL
jgi:predicted AlkP superfamily phosphohydrolase/phosphomutase